MPSLLDKLRVVPRSFGLDVVRYRPHPLDVTPEDAAVLDMAQPFTMTSQSRLLAVVEATKHVVKHNIPGAIVECGVWRGGSVMAAALTLRNLDCLRELYLFDTFAGLPIPSSEDVDLHGNSAEEHWERVRTDQGSSDWCKCGLEQVRANLLSTGYEPTKVHFVEGTVQDTIPQSAPDQIALLRLDTDWYDSTVHELTHLYPRLSPGGILIIDDYGYWRGARKAVDEYLGDSGIFFHRIDYTGRLVIKPLNGSVGSSHSPLTGHIE